MSRARDRADGDFAGKELIFDADGDTSITADTDDQIDIKVAGSDHVKIKGGTNVVHVIEGSSGQGTPHTNSALVLESDGQTGINILSGNTDFAGLVFGDDGDNDIGFIQYKHDDNYIRFGTNTSEKMRIASDGDVTITDGDLVIGTAGHGIDFSSNTQSAVSGVSNQSELLDFYEEGDWTPVAYGASTSGSVTSGTLTGKYTRIGRMVHIEARATAVVLSSANGSYYVDGLPFTVGGTGYNSGSVSLYKVNFDDNTYVEVNASGTTVYFLVSRDNTTWTTLDQSVFGSQHYWHFTIIYTV